MSEVSQKQLEANRQNAKLGGVKTEEGKAVSRFNALKHGLLSSEVLMEGEEQNDLEELSKSIRKELKPASQLEHVLVDRIIANTWRLKRAMKIEREMMYCDMEDLFFDEGKKHKLGRAIGKDLGNSDSYGKFIRYEASLERGIYKALHELQRIQAGRSGDKPPLPVAIDVDMNNE